MTVEVNALNNLFPLLRNAEDVCKHLQLRLFDDDPSAPCRITLTRSIYQLTMQNPDLVDHANIQIITDCYNAINKLYNPTTIMKSPTLFLDLSLSSARLFGEKFGNHNIKDAMIRNVI